MNNGIISGNRGRSYNVAGGGVLISRGNFTKTGGIIYGYDENDTVNSNITYSRDANGVNIFGSDLGLGHAVFAGFDSESYFRKRKETTAGPEINLFFNGTVDPPTFIGGWDY